MMNNSITISTDININNSGINIYTMFQDIIKKLYKSKVLNDKDMEKIYVERMSVLQYKLKLYTKDETSSVKYEIALKMMKNIDYSVSVYLNSLPNMDAIILSIKDKNINSMADLGCKLMNNYLEEGEVLLKSIQENKINTENIAYIDTIERGLPVFFKCYDSYFNALETDADIDYPVKDRKVQYDGYGIIYVMRYMRCLYLENKFLKYFDDETINTLLKSYDTRSKELLINIFTIVLNNAIGLLICNSNPKKLKLTPNDISELYNKLFNVSKNDLYEIIYKNAEKCCSLLNINDNELVNYVLQFTKDITDEVYYAISINKPEIVFTPTKDEKFVIYNDHKCLSDEEFRIISDELCRCNKTKDKISIMSKCIKSFYDMIDILESDCFLQYEYEMYYESLDFSVISLLYKHMVEYDLNDDKECYECLNAFVSKHNLKQKIDKIKDKIIIN